MQKRLLLPVFLPFLMPLLAGFSLAAHGASARPPTVDPTYGLPIPRLHAPAHPAVSAQWIWVGKTLGTQIVRARAKVTLPAATRTATLFVTGDDSATAFVNGHRVVTTDPAEQGWKQVRRESVGPFLHAGRNVIALEGVNGGGAAGLLARLDVNGKMVLQTGPGWKVSESPAPPAHWADADFDDTRWQAATSLAPVGQGPWSTALNGWPGVGDAAWYLAHLTVRPTAVEALSGQVGGTLAAGGLTVKAVPAGEAPAAVRVDFGREIAGRLLLQGTPGTALRVTTGETVAELTHAEPGLDNSGPYDLTLAADGPATTPYSAFRYALLTFPSRQAAALTQIDCDHKYYPVAYKGSFACSDPLLTRIWYAGAYTAHLCMQEDIWDAPKRDRGLWGGDLHATGATINDAFADTFLMEHSLSRLPSTAVGGAYDPTQPVKDINALPGYTSSWFCTLADFHRHVGDLAFLKSQHRSVLALLAYQQGEFDADHLFTNPHHDWSFVDWAPDFVLDSPESHEAIDLFDVRGVREAVFLLRAMGDAANAAKYDAWAKTLTEAARSRYADAATGTYGDRLQTNVMAVYAGIATPAQRSAIYAHVLKADSPVWTPLAASATNTAAYPMTPYYGNYVLRAYADLNRPQDGLDLIRRYWGAMMARGTTTLWEQFDPAMPADFKRILDLTPYLSFSHGWSTGPTGFLSEYVLGVRPTSGGMKTVEIVPFLGDLAWAEGSVPAPSGLIHVRAVRVGSGEDVTLGLPPGVDAQVGLPSPAVTVNGLPAPIVRRAAGVSYVRLSRVGTYRLKSIGKPSLGHPLP